MVQSVRKKVTVELQALDYDDAPGAGLPAVGVDRLGRELVPVTLYELLMRLRQHQAVALHLHGAEAVGISSRAVLGAVAPKVAKSATLSATLNDEVVRRAVSVNGPPTTWVAVTVKLSSEVVTVSKMVWVVWSELM